MAIIAKVPVVPGTGLINTPEEAALAAEEIGYPIILKATAGGGGMGLSVCRSQKELVQNFINVQSRSSTLFKNSGVFLEKYIEHGRHIEVQIFGNGIGGAVAFGERECSIQRRHQKVIEEAPSPFISKDNSLHANLRQRLCDCSISLAESAKYKSAGTVEYLVDDDTGSFFFLEMNTRLQVEHGITELCYDTDLVYLMLLQADYEIEKEQQGIPIDQLKSFVNVIKKSSDDGSISTIPNPNGHSIEVRIYAENPLRDFAPSPGTLHNVEFPSMLSTDYKVRIDHWISTGLTISPNFDPMLAKVMVWSTTRDLAIKGMLEVLSTIKIQGPPNNIDFLRQLLSSSVFQTGYTLTSTLQRNFKYDPHYVDFLDGGAYTSIQQLPGRLNIDGGIVLSGPMDSYAYEVANILVGNPRTMEALEITFMGPKMVFHVPTVIALCGGRSFKFTINGHIKETWTAYHIPAGAEVVIGDNGGSKDTVAVIDDIKGARAYLAVKGGFPQVADYLGSKSCSPALKFGGHQGRTILQGDALEISPCKPTDTVNIVYELPRQCIPKYKDGVDETNSQVWRIRSIPGPHDTEEILSKEGRDLIYNSIWKVNHNSNRGGIRLEGPKPIFSRKSGGDGGGHPSNILEYPYPTCGLSFTGDSTVLFGVDGATLSGFVCVSVPIISDWWKFGQACPGDKIQFYECSWEEARTAAIQREEYIQYIASLPLLGEGASTRIQPFDDSVFIHDGYMSGNDSLLYKAPKSCTSSFEGLELRQGGEKMIVIDFGITKFDVFNCGRQMALKRDLENYRDESITSAIERIESVTGAFGVVFDPEKITQKKLVETILSLEKPNLGDDLKFPSKIYKLPVAFNHSAIDECIARYMKSQRNHAYYLPDNTKFLMEANGIPTYQQFKDQLIGQNQLVVAVSFLCALPLFVHIDPRKRLLTPKYNPARTFTPAGAVSTGSSAQCIYSVDAPGGYMLWGMTLPNSCWDTFSTLPGFEKDKPWLCNIFDQIVFYEVDEPTLNNMNLNLLAGKHELEYDEEIFDFIQYKKFLDSIREETDKHASHITKCNANIMTKEAIYVEEWEKQLAEADENSKEGIDKLLDDPNIIKIKSPMNANVWKIEVKPGQKIKKHQSFMILEAMKMEIPVRSQTDEELEVIMVATREGDVVSLGDNLIFAQMSQIS